MYKGRSRLFIWGRFRKSSWESIYLWIFNHIRHMIKRSTGQMIVTVGRSKPQLNMPLSGYCSDILRMDSTNADALYVRGLCLYYEDCIEKAVQFFVQALRMAPDHEKACIACRVSSGDQIWVGTKASFLSLFERVEGYRITRNVRALFPTLPEYLVLSLEIILG